MPQIFKSLATVAAWILFVGGCLGTLSVVISWLTKVGFIAIPKTEILLGFLTVTAALLSAVVIMKLRQMMG